MDNLVNLLDLLEGYLFDEPFATEEEVEDLLDELMLVIHIHRQGLTVEDWVNEVHNPANWAFVEVPDDEA